MGFAPEHAPKLLAQGNVRMPLPIGRPADG